MLGKIVSTVFSQGENRRFLPMTLLVAALGSGLAVPASAQVSVQGMGRGQAISQRLEISPEGVQKLGATNTPFVLLDADERDVPSSAANSSVRRIYYTVGPWSRSAQNKVQQDRKANAGAISETEKFASQRLAGTPLDWQSVGLKFNRSPLPSRPLSISPKQLGEAIKDGVDLQIIDLRPLDPGSEAALAPSARRVLPHQLDNDPGLLAKQRWIVLVDSGNRVAQPFADRLFAKGYVLIAVLDGGYPAWVEATDR